MEYRSPFSNDPSITAEIEEKSLRRLDSLIATFNKFVKLKYFSGLYLDSSILLNAIESYYLDLYRTKYFHNIRYADQYKMAAYTMKWLAKIRPIMIDKNLPRTDITSVHILANEFFALYVGLNSLKIDINKISEKFINNMLYILRYRNIEGMVLSSQMNLLEKYNKGRTP